MSTVNSIKIALVSKRMSRQEQSLASLRARVCKIERALKDFYVFEEQGLKPRKLLEIEEEYVHHEND